MHQEEDGEGAPREPALSPASEQVLTGSRLPHPRPPLHQNQHLQHVILIFRITPIIQDRVAVKRLLCNDKDVGSNPAATRNEKQTLGDPLHRRWPNGLGRISVEDWQCKAKLDL